jgi:hypothetical protein
MRNNLYMPFPYGRDGAKVTYSGLSREGSLVVLNGIRPDLQWNNAYVMVVNMKDNEDSLVELLRKAAIEAVNKSQS